MSLIQRRKLTVRMSQLSNIWEAARGLSAGWPIHRGWAPLLNTPIHKPNTPSLYLCHCSAHGLQAWTPVLSSSLEPLCAFSSYPQLLLWELQEKPGACLHLAAPALYHPRAGLMPEVASLVFSTPRLLRGCCSATVAFSFLLIKITGNFQPEWAFLNIQELQRL